MEKFDKPIYVTKPFLPPFSKFCEGLKEIWDNQWLTNNGPVLQRYTKKMKDFLNVENTVMFNNGTLALQIGLQGIQFVISIIMARLLLPDLKSQKS